MQTKAQRLYAGPWLVGALLAAAAPQLAQAQTQAQPKPASATVDEVVVTGTQIRGAAPTGSAIASIGAEQIRNAPQATVSDMVRQLPQVALSGATEGLLTGGFNPASNRTYGNGINLRALGPDATLVLLNGHRVAKTGTQANFTDISMIPAAAVQRVELVADGASAVYGSDAIGGVVNMILRDNFKGAETSFRSGGGDGFGEWVASQTAGLTWEGGSAFVAYERYHRDNLAASERSFFSQDLRAFGGKDYRSKVAAYPGNVVISGVTYAIPATIPAGGLKAANFIVGVPNAFDNTQNSDILPLNDRDTFIGTVRQNLTDKLKVYGDFIWSKRDFEQHPQGGVPTATVNVPRTNPFFVHPTNAAAATVPVSYAFINELGPRQDLGFTRNTGASGTAEYALPKSWRVRATGTWNRDHNYRDQTNAINNTALATAIADTNPATALNLFGGPNNPATVAKLRLHQQVRVISTMDDYEVQADGPLWSLPGGPARLAIGASQFSEYIHYTQYNDDVVTADGKTDRRDQAVFAELYLPVIGPENAIPGVRKLTVSLAGRAEKYNTTAGSTKNPKVGVVWSPIDSLELRASYGTSFKAPALAYTLKELALLVQPSLRVDPRTGLQVQTLGLTGGNPNLNPETATTWSGGFDWRPSFGRRTKFSMTYFNVEYANQVGLPSIDLNQFAIYAPYIIRDPDLATVNRYLSGEIAVFLGGKPAPESVRYILDNRFQNLGGFRTRGVDVAVNYGFDTPVGEIDLSGSITRTLKYENQAVAGLAWIDRLNTPLWPQEWRGRGEATWSHGPWRASAVANYVGSYTDNLVTPNFDVDSFVTIDGSLSFNTDALQNQLLHGISITLSAQNLLDKDPPFVSSDSGNLYGYDPGAASAMGRFVAVKISKSW